MLLISEQYKWSDNFACYQDASRRADTLVCNPDYDVGDFLETDAGFAWMKVAGVRVNSCYFSLNDPFEVLETPILHLKESQGEAIGRTLIASDSFLNDKYKDIGD